MSDTKEAARAATISDVVSDALGNASLAYNDAHILDDKALLAKYEFGELDVTFAMRDHATNEILREKEPCYELLADGFYGRGLHGTWFQEGATIVTYDVPNQHMRPLNRAAGIAFAKWMESLPQNKVVIEIGDMAEAAVILSKDSRVEQMTPSQAQLATIKVAEGLKLKREGKNAMDLRIDGINRNFAPQSGGKAPPMVGAKTSDMSQIGPGMTRAMAANVGPENNVRRAAPLGGPPPGR